MYSLSLVSIRWFMNDIPAEEKLLLGSFLVAGNWVFRLII